MLVTVINYNKLWTLQLLTVKTVIDEAKLVLKKLSKYSSNFNLN